MNSDPEPSLTSARHQHTAYNYTSFDTPLVVQELLTLLQHLKDTFPEEKVTAVGKDIHGKLAAWSSYNAPKSSRITDLGLNHHLMPLSQAYANMFETMDTGVYYSDNLKDTLICGVSFGGVMRLACKVGMETMMMTQETVYLQHETYATIRRRLYGVSPPEFLKDPAKVLTYEL